MLANHMHIAMVETILSLLQIAILKETHGAFVF